MKIIKVKNYDDLSKRAGAIISSVITLNPKAVLGLATGSSPLGVYKYLVEQYKNGILDFSEIKSINLDEYRNLRGDHEQSYRYFMNKNLFSQVNINPDNTFVPNGMEADSTIACDNYENIINNLPQIELQLLGLGHDGHIGFNEPCEVFPQKTHCVKLTETTINANKRFFNSIDEVPKEAYTMGIGTIMKAKSILVIVSGKDKAEILNKVITGPVTPMVPASILQFHPDVTIVADKDALSKTSNRVEG